MLHGKLNDYFDKSKGTSRAISNIKFVQKINIPAFIIVSRRSIRRRILKVNTFCKQIKICNFNYTVVIKYFCLSVINNVSSTPTVGIPTYCRSKYWNYFSEIFFAHSIK
jgi:hypothetical protein